MSDVKPSTSNDDKYFKELVAVVATEHGVALDKSDPLAILQTTTRKIIQDFLKDVQTAQKDIMTLQQTEMEMASKRWRQEAKASAENILREMEILAKGAVGDAATLAAQAASDRIIAALQRHEHAMNRVTTIMSIVAVIVVIAASAVLLYS